MNYFRGALQSLSETFLTNGDEWIIFAGPRLPAFRVAVPFASPICVQDATSFYNEYLSPPFFGERQILGISLHVAGACLFAALPPNTEGCTWVVPEGCGVDCFQGDAQGSNIGSRPVSDETTLVPRIIFQRIGVRWHRWLADPSRGTAEQPLRTPERGRLLAAPPVSGAPGTSSLRRSLQGYEAPTAMLPCARCRGPHNSEWTLQLILIGPLGMTGWTALDPASIGTSPVKMYPLALMRHPCYR